MWRKTPGAVIIVINNPLQPLHLYLQFLCLLYHSENSYSYLCYNIVAERSMVCPVVATEARDISTFLFIPSLVWIPRLVVLYIWYIISTLLSTDSCAHIWPQHASLLVLKVRCRLKVEKWRHDIRWTSAFRLKSSFVLLPCKQTLCDFTSASLKPCFMYSLL